MTLALILMMIGALLIWGGLTDNSPVALVTGIFQSAKRKPKNA